MKSPPRRVFPSPPTAARALLLRAHPHLDSFNHALAQAWSNGATAAGIEVETLDLCAMDFDPVLRDGYRTDQPLEPALAGFQASVAAAAHVAIAFPVWWGSTPARLKGLFDRAFLPGWAYASGSGALPDKGLVGRTGRLLVTLDAPGWYDRLVYSASARRQVRDATLRFVGISPVGVSAFAAIEKSTAESRDKMLARAERDGRRDGRAVAARFQSRLRSTTRMGEVVEGARARGR